MSNCQSITNIYWRVLTSVFTASVLQFSVSPSSLRLSRFRPKTKLVVKNPGRMNPPAPIAGSFVTPPCREEVQCSTFSVVKAKANEEPMLSRIWSRDKVRID